MAKAETLTGCPWGSSRLRPGLEDNKTEQWRGCPSGGLSVGSYCFRHEDSITRWGLSSLSHSGRGSGMSGREFACLNLWQSGNLDQSWSLLPNLHHFLRQNHDLAYYHTKKWEDNYIDTKIRMNKYFTRISLCVAVDVTGWDATSYRLWRVWKSVYAVDLIEIGLSALNDFSVRPW